MDAIVAVYSDWGIGARGTQPVVLHADRAHRQDITIEGAETAHSTEEALALAAKYERCFVIGGASVFRQFFPYLDRVEITKIELAPPSDSFFPDLDADPDWICAEAGEWQEEDGVRFCFCTYERKREL